MCKQHHFDWMAWTFDGVCTLKTIQIKLSSFWAHGVFGVCGVCVYAVKRTNYSERSLTFKIDKTLLVCLDFFSSSFALSKRSKSVHYLFIICVQNSVADARTLSQCPQTPHWTLNIENTHIAFEDFHCEMEIFQRRQWIFKFWRWI